MGDHEVPPPTPVYIYDIDSMSSYQQLLLIKFT
jgi:hypothetical protein